MAVYYSINIGFFLCATLLQPSHFACELSTLPTPLQSREASTVLVWPQLRLPATKVFTLQQRSTYAHICDGELMCCNACFACFLLIKYANGMSAVIEGPTNFFHISR